MPIRYGLLLILALLLAACAGTPAATPTPEAAQIIIPTEDARPAINVVVTTGMIADMVKSIGGTRVNVTQLMGPGVDPHLYTASENDVQTISNAQIIFYNGLNLEARLSEIFQQIGQSKPVIALGDRLPPELIKKHEGYDAPDPHIWMDVSLWAQLVTIVRDELTKLDPDSSGRYSLAADAYRQSLNDVHNMALETIATIPEEQRILITAHDAFAYFGRAYNIEVFAPQGITTAAEAGVEDIRRTIQLIIDRKVPAIFVETSVPPDVMDAIIAGAAAQGVTVANGGALYSDAMGQPDTQDGTYAGMIRHNVDTIVAALNPTPQQGQ